VNNVLPAIPTHAHASRQQAAPRAGDFGSGSGGGAGPGRPAGRGGCHPPWPTIGPPGCWRGPGGVPACGAWACRLPGPGAGAAAHSGSVLKT
jgi:hypothetical protein